MARRKEEKCVYWGECAIRKLLRYSCKGFGEVIHSSSDHNMGNLRMECLDYTPGNKYVSTASPLTKSASRVGYLPREINRKNIAHLLLVREHFSGADVGGDVLSETFDDDERLVREAMEDIDPHETGSPYDF